MKRPLVIDLTDSDNDNDLISFPNGISKKPTGQEFTDPDFPACEASLGFIKRVSAELCLCSHPCVVRRVFKAGPNHGRCFLSCAKKTCKFFRFLSHDEVCYDRPEVIWRRFRVSEGWRMVQSKGFRPSDIQQGKLGNCWFLSALSVIATREDLIDNIVVSRDIPDRGEISFRLFLDGDWRIVTVDNQLPCSSDSPQGLLFAKSYSSQLWVPFLEKAYAKAHGGYAAISGGEISEAFLDLTGAPCETVDFNDEVFSSELLWLRLKQWTAEGFPVGCATAESGEGIVGMHAYSILEVRELDNARLGHQRAMTDYIHLDADARGGSSKWCFVGEDKDGSNWGCDGIVRLVKIRNPWGKREWQGAFAKGDSLWTRKLKIELEQVDKDNGEFWMTFHDFLRRYVRVDVCKAATKGWLGISRSSTTNPMRLNTKEEFSMEVLEHCRTFLWLIQKTKRRRDVSNAKSNWYSDLSLIVVDDAGEPISSRFSSGRRDTTPLELHLNPGKYRLRVMHFDCRHPEPFILRVYVSSVAVVIDSLPSQDDGAELVQRCVSFSRSSSLQDYIHCRRLWIGLFEEAEISISLLVFDGMNFIRVVNMSSMSARIEAEICYKGYRFMGTVSTKVKDDEGIPGVQKDRHIACYRLKALHQIIAAICLLKDHDDFGERSIHVLSVKIDPLDTDDGDLSLIPMFNAFSLIS